MALAKFVGSVIKVAPYVSVVKSMIIFVTIHLRYRYSNTCPVLSLSKLLNPYQRQRHNGVPVKGSKQKIVSLHHCDHSRLQVRGGTYRLACGGDLYRLVKLWEHSLLHFPFP